MVVDVRVWLSVLTTELSYAVVVLSEMFVSSIWQNTNMGEGVKALGRLGTHVVAVTVATVVVYGVS